jgi:hypothetical protein
LRHVIVSSEEGLPRLHGRADRAQGYQRDVAVSVSQYGLVPAILAATDLVCSLPQEFLACHTGQLDIDLPLDAGQFDLSMPGIRAATATRPTAGCAQLLGEIRLPESVF